MTLKAIENLLFILNFKILKKKSFTSEIEVNCLANSISTAPAPANKRPSFNKTQTFK